MRGYDLNEGLYNTEPLSNEKMWETFNWLFSTYSRNDTSYKFIFLKAIIDCVEKRKNVGKITFDSVFFEYTRIAWSLVLKYCIAQKAIARDGRRTVLENTLNKYCHEYIEFENLSDEKKKEICHEVKIQCKKYVVGALYGDTDGYFYSFSKKEEWIELNPLMETFIKDNKDAINDLNYYKWAKFYENVNDIRLITNTDEVVKGVISRKGESVFRLILAYEFERGNSLPPYSWNYFEKKSINQTEQLTIDAINEVEDVIYQDIGNFKKFIDDPVLLLREIKKKKGICP